MFSTRKTEDKKSALIASTSSELLNKLYDQKYKLQCLDRCFETYNTNMSEEEKICLVKCADFFHGLTVSHGDMMLKVKSTL